MRAEPIAAVATAPGRGAVGIVRASGPDLGPLVQALFGRALAPRVATLLPFTAADGSPIDRGLAIHFPGPHSYTGEDVLELQAHGGPVLLRMLLSRVLEAGAPLGLRLAEPGEFTLRAFLNDKIDLAQAEAVADLIDASTEAAARSAARSLSGAFSAEVDALAAQVLELRTLVEATLDFPEEEIDFLEAARARERLARIRATLDAALERARQGALLREGLQVVIAGLPNVGKSSLLNALAGAELAIVTPIPGTTRDRVKETIAVRGVPLHVVDTAGLRGDDETDDAVERIGIARSWASIGEADALLFVHDLARHGEPEVAAAEARIAARLSAAVARGGAAQGAAGEAPHGVIHVWNKADAAPEAAAVAVRAADPSALVISARSGAGLDALRDALLARAGCTAPPEGLFLARERHLRALHDARRHLAAADEHAARRDAALDLFAEELRLAHRALGSITGPVDADALLGEIFGRFCIGK